MLIDEGGVSLHTSTAQLFSLELWILTWGGFDNYWHRLEIQIHVVKNAKLGSLKHPASVTYGQARGTEILTVLFNALISSGRGKMIQINERFVFCATHLIKLGEWFASIAASQMKMRQRGVEDLSDFMSAVLKASEARLVSWYTFQNVYSWLGTTVHGWTWYEGLMHYYTTATRVLCIPGQLLRQQSIFRKITGELHLAINHLAIESYYRPDCIWR